MLMKSPRPKSSDIMARVTSISSRVKPACIGLFLVMEILCDSINRCDDRDRDEPDHKPHHDHEKRLDERGKVFGEVIDLRVVHLGKIDECFRERAGLLSYGYHMPEHIGEKRGVLAHMERHF